MISPFSLKMAERWRCRLSDIRAFSTAASANVLGRASSDAGVVAIHWPSLDEDTGARCFKARMSVWPNKRTSPRRAGNTAADAAR